MSVIIARVEDSERDGERCEDSVHGRRYRVWLERQRGSNETPQNNDEGGGHDPNGAYKVFELELVANRSSPAFPEGRAEALLG